jgi:hypothetical protein
LFDLIALRVSMSGVTGMPQDHGATVPQDHGAHDEVAHQQQVPRSHLIAATCWPAWYWLSRPHQSRKEGEEGEEREKAQEAQEAQQGEDDQGRETR